MWFIWGLIRFMWFISRIQISCIPTNATCQHPHTAPAGPARATMAPASPGTAEIFPSIFPSISNQQWKLPNWHIKYIYIIWMLQRNINWKKNWFLISMGIFPCTCSCQLFLCLLICGNFATAEFCFCSHLRALPAVHTQVERNTLVQAWRFLASNHGPNTMGTQKCYLLQHVACLIVLIFAVLVVHWISFILLGFNIWEFTSTLWVQSGRFHLRPSRFLSE